jgi:hypothetical protein
MAIAAAARGFVIASLACSRYRKYDIDPKQIQGGFSSMLRHLGLRHLGLRYLGLRHSGSRLVWLSGFLIILVLSAQAVAQQVPNNETLCAFSMRKTNAWHQVPHARNVGLQRIPSSPAPHYYQNGVADMVVYCAPRFGPGLDFETSVAREVSAISHSYTDFSVLGNDRIEFHRAPAQWFLFNGLLKLKPASKHGYIIVADRGERSLVIALSTNAVPDYDYSQLFRSAVQLFSLR